MFLEHALEPVNTVGDSTVRPAQGVEMLVNALGSLFTHHPKPNMPSFKTRDNVRASLAAQSLLESWSSKST